MKKRLKILFVLIGLTLFIGGCTTNNDEIIDEENVDTETPIEEENTTDENDAIEDETEGQSFDPEIEETISIEGMEEPITLILYDNPDAPFITYYPNDLMVEEISGGEGDSYRFYANYEDNQLEDIYLEIYMYAENDTEEPSAEDPDSTFGSRVENMNLVSEDEEWFDWSIEEYNNLEESDHVVLGEHNGQHFFMYVNSDVLYSEGFIPRVNKVVEHIYWRDTQEYLDR